MNYSLYIFLTLLLGSWSFLVIYDICEVLVNYYFSTLCRDYALKDLLYAKIKNARHLSLLLLLLCLNLVFEYLGIIMIMIQISLPTQMANQLSQHNVLTVLLPLTDLKCLYYYHILNFDAYLFFLCLFFRIFSYI